MAPTDPPSSERDRQRIEWIRSTLGEPDTGLERASFDADFRSYWRTTGREPSLVLMDAPPGLMDVRPWLEIHDLLEAGGLRVPAVLARDLAQGFLLLEDLGRQTYLHILDEASADALFEIAMRRLVQLQSIAVPDGFPAYDADLLLRELRLFDEWFLGVHLGIALDDGERES
ncbi:MAG: phosphotransferase, partial [Xanthomonadaceae bacterium]|nr:phosphotransferase [Xanthomonadaceae bacterium]